MGGIFSNGQSKSENTPNFKFTGEGSGDIAIQVSHEDLIGYFTGVDGINEKIEQVWIYKYNLHSWIPKWFGLWYEFVIVQSESWFWSFEKVPRGIRVQRSKNVKWVTQLYGGERRAGNVEPEGRGPQRGNENDSMRDIFKWIYQQDCSNNGSYQPVKLDAGHHFASMLFEAIAHQKHRRL